MTSTATTAQINYANDLLDQLRQNLTIVCMTDRARAAIARVNLDERRTRILALGYDSPRKAPTEVKAAVEAHMVAEDLAHMEALAGLTREQVEAMDSRAVSTLIDTLKARPW